MSNTWNTVQFTEAVDICDTLRKPINSSERASRIAGKKQSELYPYYGATGQVGFIDDYITDGEYVLLGEDGAPFLDAYAPKAYIINGKTWVNNHAHVLRSKTNNKFLCYYLNSFNYKGFVSGTTRLKLTQAEMKRIPVPVPSIPEQERIVARIEELFSQLDAGVETLKKTKAQLAVYRQAVLKEAFDSVSASLYRPLSTAILGSPQNGLYKPKSDYCNTGTPILRIDGFYDGHILSDYCYKRVNLSAVEIERYGLDVGDLVINRVNSMPYLGKCALVRSLTEPTIFESNMMRIKLNTDMVIGDWISYYLSSRAGKKELTKNAKQAVNQASINQTDVGNALVPIPSTDDQRQLTRVIESRLSVCYSIEQTVDAALQQAKAMRQSILKDAFEGRL